MTDAAWLPFILLMMSDTMFWRCIFAVWFLTSLPGGEHACAAVLPGLTRAQVKQPGQFAKRRHFASCA